MELTVAGTVPDFNRIPFYAANERWACITITGTKVWIICKTGYKNESFYENKFTSLWVTDKNIVGISLVEAHS